jgi:CHAD domain-containing protein
MTGSTEARRFAVEQVDKLIGQLAFQIGRTRKSHDPGPVHDLRVAIRRFVQGFILFRACFPAKDVKKIRQRLKEIMTQAGEVRNCDIAIKLLSKSKLKEADAFKARFQTLRKEGERILLGTLRRWKERKTSLKWRTRLQAASAADKTPAGTVEETAMRKLPRMAKEFFDRGRKTAGGSGSAEKLHEFRLATKKFRYTLELLAPLYGPTLAARLERIRNMQALLGGINDCATVRQMVSRWSGGAGVDAELRKKQRKQTKEFQRQWTEEFGGPEKVQLWMDYLSGSEDSRRPARKPVARSLSAAGATIDQASGAVLRRRSGRR